MENKNHSQFATHSLWILISYNFFEFIQQIIGKTFTGLYLFYYETELLLAGGFILAAQIIFSIWNAVNDPIAGYVCNRQTRWTSKFGRYYPWILIAGIPMFFFFYLIFAPPPGIEGWLLFLWMVLVLCLADTFSSVYSINVGGMYPEKFRSETDRRKSGQINTIIGSIGMVVASILPPLLYDFDNPSSYKVMAGVMAGMGFLLVLLNLSGTKPDKHMLRVDREDEKQQSFFAILKVALQQRNFVIYLVVIFLYNMFLSFALNSLPYYIKNVMLAESTDQTYIWGGMILGIFIFLPFWNKFYKKHGVANTLLAGFLIMGVSMIPLIFFSNLIVVIIVFFIVGAGLGGFWVAYLPFFGDVMDHMYIKTGTRNTGVYMGIRTFFLRFNIIIQTAFFLLIHKLTKYDPDSDIQSTWATFGIRIHAVIIPILVVLLGSFILWKYYEIKGQKKVQLLESLARKANEEEFESI